jgi:hypothetical protein
MVHTTKWARVKRKKRNEKFVSNWKAKDAEGYKEYKRCKANEYYARLKGKKVPGGQVGSQAESHSRRQTAGQAESQAGRLTKSRAGSRGRDQVEGQTGDLTESLVEATADSHDGQSESQVQGQACSQADGEAGSQAEVLTVALPTADALAEQEAEHSRVLTALRRRFNRRLSQKDLECTQLLTKVSKLTRRVAELKAKVRHLQQKTRRNSSLETSRLSDTPMKDEEVAANREIVQALISEKRKLHIQRFMRLLPRF